MRRALRLLLVLPLLLTAACGDDDEATPPPSPVVSAPAAPVTSDPVPEPTDSVDYDEEDPDPPTEAGDLSDEAQAQLDQALGTELEALDGAPPADAAKRRATLDKLPEKPEEVLTALAGYDWFSPDAEALYRKAAQGR